MDDSHQRNRDRHFSQKFVFDVSGHVALLQRRCFSTKALKSIQNDLQRKRIIDFLIKIEVKLN